MASWITGNTTSRDFFLSTLQWRHSEHDGVSIYQPHDCLPNRLFGYRSKKPQSSASRDFVRGIHRERWICRTKGQVRGKCFHLMTSSWNINVLHHWPCVRGIHRWLMDWNMFAKMCVLQAYSRAFPLVQFSRNFIPEWQIANQAALVQLMEGHKTGNKPN